MAGHVAGSRPRVHVGCALHCRPLAKPQHALRGPTCCLWYTSLAHQPCLHTVSQPPCVVLLPAAAGVLKLVHDCVMMLSPFILEQLLKELQGEGSRAWNSIWGKLGSTAAVAFGLQGGVRADRLSFRAATRLAKLVQAGAHISIRCHVPTRSAPTCAPAGLVALGLAAALAAGSLSETLLINTYFHILFRMCAHLKVGTDATCYLLLLCFCLYGVAG